MPVWLDIFNIDWESIKQSAWYDLFKYVALFLLPYLRRFIRFLFKRYLKPGYFVIRDFTSRILIENMRSFENAAGRGVPVRPNLISQGDKLQSYFYFL
jgi:hypothetical protein